MSGWFTTNEYRKWQKKALPIWLKNQRGVISVTTGAGKTYFAFAAMQEIRRQHPDCKFLIIVPRVSLLDQWKVSLISDFNVPEEEIALAGGGHKFTSPNLVNVMVAMSAAKIAPTILREGNWFLIVDECHRIASESNRETIQGTHFATLGLSATPEREYDDWFDEFVVPSLGEIVFKYSYADGVRDKIIVPFDVENVEVPLTDDESIGIEKFNRRLAILFTQQKEGIKNNNKAITRTLIQRSQISKAAQSRIPTTIELAKRYAGLKGLIFHEYIGDAEELTSLLKEDGHRVECYHSKLSHVRRQLYLSMFKTGELDILVTCTSLDEGVDVPDANYAIIASSSSTKRQRIQRVGRVLRTSEGKTRAKVTTLYCLPSEKRVLQEEIANAEGTNNVKWLTAVRP